MAFTSSLLFWAALAMLLFWGVGAYNRLVRLRSEAKSAFASVETELARQVALVQACLPPADEVADLQSPGDNGFWSSLEGAALQFSASLKSAKHMPLDPERIAALGAAIDVLASAWERAERDDAHDLAGSRLPERVAEERSQLTRMSMAAIEQFNQAVGRYNQAIAQFPASLLAWIFGFQAARGLRAAR